MTHAVRARNESLKPEERLIVALDVPNQEDALRFVDELEGVATFYKIGLELLLGGGVEALLRRLIPGKKVFVDLKLPNDIPETVKRAVSVAADHGVTFLTLSNSVTEETIRAAVAGRGTGPDPKLLFVPFLSSVDRADFAKQTGQEPAEFEHFLQRRAEESKRAGADGFIVSGQEIQLLRNRHPDAVLVSPGIRPVGSTSDDHKRSCTPAEAMRFGADYIVVGRPIRNAPNRREAAARIVEEIASAMA